MALALWRVADAGLLTRAPGNGDPPTGALALRLTLAVGLAPFGLASGGRRPHADDRSVNRALRLRLEPVAHATFAATRSRDGADPSQPSLPPLPFSEVVVARPVLILPHTGTAPVLPFPFRPRALRTDPT